MIGKFSIFPFEHCLIGSIGCLELLVVLYTSKPCVLVEVWYTIHLVALARPERVHHLPRVLGRPVGSWAQDVEVHSGVIHQGWPLRELLRVVQAINLPWLSIGPISLLLNLVRGLSVGLLMVSLSESNVWATLIGQLITIQSVCILVYISANWVGLLSVHQVEVLHLLILALIVFVKGV